MTSNTKSDRTAQAKLAMQTVTYVAVLFVLGKQFGGVTAGLAAAAVGLSIPLAYVVGEYRGGRNVLEAVQDD